MQRTDFFHGLLGVSWLAVGNIVERVVSRRLDGARFTRLKRIGIDEFSYRKRHCYLTVVVDHDTRRVVWAGAGHSAETLGHHSAAGAGWTSAWAGAGRSAETLGAFFEQLGPGGCARLELVTVDLASSWQKALAAWAPHARVVFDRFHVERLAADAVDEVRRAEQRRLAPAEAKALKGARYALLKRPDRLKPGEVRRLETLRRANRALDRACELKDYLAMILGQATPEGASEMLAEWLEWAARSRLKPFVKLGRTVRKHAEGILAYLDTRMTNGPVEGINNRLHVIARRAYGFHSPGPLISMLFLCCGGIELAPPLPTSILRRFKNTPNHVATLSFGHCTMLLLPVIPLTPLTPRSLGDRLLATLGSGARARRQTSRRAGPSPVEPGRAHRDSSRAHDEVHARDPVSGPARGAGG